MRPSSTPARRYAWSTRLSSFGSVPSFRRTIEPGHDRARRIVVALQTPGKSSKNKFPRFKPRNSLKNIDSTRESKDPRESKARGGGLAAKRARAKKIQTDRLDQRCGPC